MRIHNTVGGSLADIGNDMWRDDRYLHYRAVLIERCCKEEKFDKKLVEVFNPIRRKGVMYGKGTVKSES